MRAESLDDLRRLPSALSDESRELLHAEYEHLATSLISNEEGGERRVNVLLTLIAAVIAAIGLGADRHLADVARLAATVTAASAILLIYGLVTLRRLMQRNLATTEYINGLRRIRAFFINADPAILEVLPFVPGKIARRTRKPWWGLGRAGFLEVVATTNCLLAAVGVGACVWLSLESPETAIVGALLLLVVAWLAQMWWVKSTYESEGAEQDEQRVKALAAWRGEPAITGQGERQRL